MKLPLISPVECPNCRRAIPRPMLFLRTAWSRWRCKGCDAVLGIDTRRRFLGMIPWLAIALFLLFVVRITGFGLTIAIPILLSAAVLNFFMIDRVVMHERTGFRCRNCGYDLTGQHEGRCPECAESFSLAELSAYDVYDDRPRKPAMPLAWRIGIVVLFAAMALMVVAGLVVLRR